MLGSLAWATYIRLLLGVTNFSISTWQYMGVYLQYIHQTDLTA